MGESERLCVVMGLVALLAFSRWICPILANLGFRTGILVTAFLCIPNSH